ncbi:MAG: hypothetical protein QW756_02150 [Nitrososphaerota archaeon]
MEPAVQRYWITSGTPENWQTSLAFGKIWGLVGKSTMIRRWEKIKEGDKILIYVMKPVGGVVGHGTIRTKFKQDKPLWPLEVKENKVIWPYRFEFDIDYLLPQHMWRKSSVKTEYIKNIARAGFQFLNYEEAVRVVELLKTKEPHHPPLPQAPEPIDLHDRVKAMLVEIGRLQGYVSESEYSMDGARLDVVWRRVERAVPTYVFEVQVGGDLYHALSKLKHARDIWNSKIYIAVTDEDKPKANELLSGTFHEIREEIKVILIHQVTQLYKMKKDYKDLERNLGIS